MKRLISFLIIFLSINVISNGKMKIEQNLYNKATHELSIKTSWYSFSTNNEKIPNIHIRFIYDKNEEFIEIKHITNEIVSISHFHYIQFKTEKNKTYKALADKSYIADKGNGSIGYAGSHAIGINSVYNSDFIWLHDYLPLSLIIETNEKNIEIKLPKKVAKDIQKLYQLFFKTIEKNYKK